MNNRLHQPTYFPISLALALTVLFAGLVCLLGRFHGAYAFLGLLIGCLLLLFGSLKLFNLKNFITAFRAFDPIARHFKAYAWLYPLMELSLALLYLTSELPFQMYLITFIIMSVSFVGAATKMKSVEHAHHAPLLRLPYPAIGLIESAIVGLLALVMLTRFI